MTRTPAVQILDVYYQYDQHEALRNLSLTINAGELFALLGPNGSGKSTLFRLISTLVPLQKGEIVVGGVSVREQASQVRRALGVVFQNPALDKHLTILENITCHAHLYGIRGQTLHRRIDAMLTRFQLTSRAGDKVLSLSGGMRRKVELAKTLITEPAVLLLDEPSTGLDVSARIELWKLLDEMREKTGLTILLTTHLMDEADRCDRVAIIDSGKLIACETPAELKNSVGGDVITLTTSDPQPLIARLKNALQIHAHQLGGVLRIEQPQAHLLVPRLIESAPGMIDSISIGRPTLDDVFVQLTGRRFEDQTLTSIAG